MTGRDIVSTAALVFWLLLAAASIALHPIFAAVADLRYVVSVMVVAIAAVFIAQLYSEGRRRIEARRERNRPSDGPVA